MVESRANQRGPDLLKGDSVTWLYRWCHEKQAHRETDLTLKRSEDPNLEDGISRFLKVVDTFKSLNHTMPAKQRLSEVHRWLETCLFVTWVAESSSTLRLSWQCSSHLTSCQVLFFLPRQHCLLRPGTLGVISSLILHSESGPQIKTIFYLCFLPTIHRLVPVQPETQEPQGRLLRSKEIFKLSPHPNFFWRIFFL